MNKKVIIIFIVGLLVGVLLIGTGLYLNLKDNNEDANNNNEVENNEENVYNNSSNIEEFNRIVKNAFENTKKDKSYSDEYPSFYVDSIHATGPGVWGAEKPDTYYYNSNGTYLWTLSTSEGLAKKVASAGKFEIQDNKLILTELYTLTREDGKIIEGTIPGGEIGNLLADYKFQVNDSNKTYSYTIKNEGLSSYKSESRPDDTRPDSYSLTGNGESQNWFSLSNGYPASYNYLANWLDEYYEIIK